MTQPKTDLAYLRSEKTKAEQKLRSCQHREKILERQMSELNRRERVHRLCTRAGICLLYTSSDVVYDSDSSWQCSKYRNMYVSCTSHFIKTSTIEATILKDVYKRQIK